jgi:hypothetical protein
VVADSVHRIDWNDARQGAHAVAVRQDIAQDAECCKKLIDGSIRCSLRRKAPVLMHVPLCIDACRLVYLIREKGIIVGHGHKAAIRAALRLLRAAVLVMC